MQSDEPTGSGNATSHSSVLFSFSGQRFESTIGGARDRADKEERGSRPGDNCSKKLAQFTYYKKLIPIMKRCTLSEHSQNGWFYVFSAHRNRWN